MMNKTESFKSLKKKKRQTSLKILLLHFPKESLNSLQLFNHHTEQIQYNKNTSQNPVACQAYQSIVIGIFQ